MWKDNRSKPWTHNNDTHAWGLTTHSSRVNLVAGNESNGHSPEGRPYHQRGETISQVSVTQTSIHARPPGKHLASDWGRGEGGRGEGGRKGDCNNSSYVIYMYVHAQSCM